MIILSIYYQRHDGAVTVMEDGEILYYSQEENFTTIKHDNTVWCSLVEVANKFDHFDVVFVHTMGSENDPTEKTLSAMLGVLDFTYDNLVVDKVNHHLWHAALGYYHSGFDEALCVVIDGHGSILPEGRESGTIIYVKGTEFEYKYRRVENIVKSERNGIQKTWTYWSEDSTIDASPTPSSGSIYEKGTMELGWTWADAGKTMGLSQCFGYEDKVEEPYKSKIPFAYQIHKIAENEAMKLIEKAIDMSDVLFSGPGSVNVVLSGGYFLNCVSNYEFVKRWPDVNFFIEPIGYDAGVSLGQAFFYDRPKPLPNINIGHKDLFEGMEMQKIVEPEYIASILESGRPVCMFQGGVEAGPRALGNRSILYDPRIETGRGIMNEVKGREQFRPFGASIMEEHMGDWFDNSVLAKSPYMLYTIPVVPDMAGMIPAVLHFNNTSRIQTVSLEDNEHFYRLLEAFKAKTNTPLLLNTSLNLAGKPIVRDLKQAIEVLQNSYLEFLWLPEIGKLMVIPNDIS